MERNGKENRKLTCEGFAYLGVRNLRFIGVDAWRTGEEWDELWARSGEFLPILDEFMHEYATQITVNCALMHHNGRAVDTENHYLAGRFFRQDTPVPEGFDFYDIPTRQAAFAIYSANRHDGDIGRAYTLTRDRILREGVKIPYPHAYWHAAVYTDGRPCGWHTSASEEGVYRFGYLFSVGGT